MSAWCGVHERLGDGSATLKLWTPKIKWFIRDSLPRLSDQAMRQGFAEAYSRWSDVCGLICTQATSVNDVAADEVLHLITVANLGGPSGVLAQMMLPYQGCKVLKMEIDVNEPWVLDDGPNPQGIDLCRTACHEIGHGIGFTHFDASPPPELLEPSYSRTIIRPQPTESKIAQGWYGPPVVKPNPLPPIPNKTVIEISGNVTSITIPGYRVTKL